MRNRAPDITAKAVSVAPDRGSCVTVGEMVPVLVRIGVTVDTLLLAVVGVGLDSLPEEAGVVGVAVG